MAVRRSSRIQPVMRRARAARAPALPVRRRRTPEQARDEALVAARALFLTEGAEAVTLQRLGAELGMVHTNLLHHFGSAAELQAALMEAMICDLATALREVAAQLEAGEVSSGGVADLLFDAFDRTGGAQLMAWMALSDRRESLRLLEPALGELAQAVARAFPQGRRDQQSAGGAAVLLLVLLAASDGLVGDAFKDMLGCEGAATRKMVSSLLPFLLGGEIL